MTMTETQIDLKKFCGDSADGKFKNDIPWVVDGFKYATDGRIAIRIQTDEPDTEFKGIEALPKMLEFTGRLSPWPTGFVEKQCECYRCFGSGRIDTVPCEDCEGNGYRICDLEHEHECGDCCGTGRAGGNQCPICSGEGRGLLPAYQLVNGRQIAACFAMLILSLPSPQCVHDDGDAMQMVHFVFDGGAGAVMPLRPD